MNLPVRTLAGGYFYHYKIQRPRSNEQGLFLVPVTGVEPVRCHHHRILSYLLHTEYKRTQTPMEVVNGHLKARNY